MKENTMDSKARKSRFGLRALTAVLTVALVLSLTPQLAGAGGRVDASGTAKAAAAKTVTNSVTKAGAAKTGLSAGNQLKKSSAGKEEASYVKGEAIVLVRSANKGIKSVTGINVGATPAFGKSDLPKGATIKDKVHFDGSTSEEARAGQDVGAAVPAADDAVRTQGSGGYVDVSLLAEGVDIYKVKSSTQSTTQLIKALRKNPKVLYAEPNWRVRATALTDSLKDYLWQIDNNGQNGGTSGLDINVDTPWNAGRKGKDYVVAVVDTGFDYTHEDLKGAEWTNNYTAKLAGKHGYDFYNGDSNPQDDNGHGSHVSGIIAAQHNTVGVAGIAPDVKVMSLKFLDEDGYGDIYGAIEAYEYIYRAMEFGVNVKAVNNSWGGWGDETSTILKAVIDRVGDKGAVTVAAAGNEYWELGSEEDNIPSNIDSPYIVSVAASTETGERADFSNWSSEYVDVAAPGTSILSSVSYPNYNPLVESELGRNNSDVYEDFESGIGSILQADCTDGAIYATSPAVAAISQDSTEFFGKTGGNSLKWDIQGEEEGEMYNIVIPYPTSAAITEDTPLWFNVDFKVTEGPELYDFWEWYGGTLIFSDTTLNDDGTLPKDFKDASKLLYSDECLGGVGLDDPGNNWTTISMPFRYENTGDKQRALVISYRVGNAAEHVIQLDNIGVSKPNPESAYTKYAFYSGTSMATPVVTASVALAAQANPSWSAKKLAAKVKTMTSPAPAASDPLYDLSDKVASGGILDLTDYNKTGKPYIDSATLSGTSVKLQGFFFGTTAGTIKATAGGISLGTVAPSAWKDEEITLPGANLKNRFVELELTKGADRASASLYMVKGKTEFTSEGALAAGDTGGMTFATDGQTVYYASGGQLWHQEEYTYDDSIVEDMDDYDAFEMVTEKIWLASSPMDYKTMFPGANENQLTTGTVDFDGGLPYVDGKFYGIAVLTAGATAEYALVSYDPAEDAWARVADRPGAEVKGTLTAGWQNIRHSTLAGYNGKLYLIGGYDGSTDKASTLVRVCDPSTGTWTAGPSLPAGQGRFYAEARQVANKLLVTLGGDGSANEVKTPATLIFDGSKWTAGKAIDNVLTADEYEGKPYFTAAVGAVKEGLIISGLAADKLGDTYIYNVAGNTYTASDVQLSQNPYNSGAAGIAVGDKLYTVAETSPGYWLYDDWTGEEWYIPGILGLFSTKVSSALYKVSGTHKGGVVQGHGSYLPGQKVTLKAVANKGYYFKQLKVDGKAVTGKTATFRITKDTKADATFVKYTTTVKLNRKTASLKPGKSVQLKATVTKAKDGVKTVTWKSSNTKYATVSKTGKVTAKKAGLGKTVTITATAKDGSKKAAKAKIKIFTKKITKLTLKAKTKKVKAGKTLQITAKFKPAKGVLKTLTWKVTKGKSYATVSSTGKLTAMPGTKGKTVTVTAYATDGSKKKASIKIKIN
jgi:subtilisin family serine protease/uncharacterized protein YjdB